MSVVYLPPGQQRPDPVGSDVRRAVTASGGTVIVSVRAEQAGGAAPFAGQLDAVVAYLVPRL